MDLSVIIVSWNVREHLACCLESVSAALDVAGLAAEIIVVDNGSTDGTEALVRDFFPNVVLIEAGANLGYTGGNNVGLRHARGRYVMILNPDTALAPDTLRLLVRFLENHPSVGAVGPALFYPDGRPQSSRRRFPGIVVGLFESTPLEPLLTWFLPLRSYKMVDIAPDEPQPVDWLVGAALVVRAPVVRQVGEFDDDFFMYFEEVDWQRRIKAAGWSIWYLPEARVTHFEAASSGQVLVRRHIRFAASKVLYYRKWYGSSVARLIRAWLWLLDGFQLVGESLKLAMGHKPALRRERIRHYREVLSSELRRG